MNTTLRSIPTRRIARVLLLLIATGAVCTFVSSCAGPRYRHVARVDNRVDRRYDRRGWY